MTARRIYWLATLAFGIGLFCWEISLLPSGEPFQLNLTMLLLIIVAALVGVLMRGVSRKVFFENKLTLHQSLSFEIIIATFSILRPWGRTALFEKWFTIRETGMEENSIEIWQSLRQRACRIMAFTGLTLILALADRQVDTIIVATITVAMASWYLATMEGHRAQIIRMIFFYILVHVAEGGIFVLGCGESIGYGNAVTLYVLFSLFYALSFVPLGIGMAELPIFWWKSSIIFIPMLIFHLFRILPLLLLQTIYLARYKFTLRDFFAADIVEKIRVTVRPSGGWPEEEKLASGMPYISLVIPAYNEEARLPEYMAKIRNYLDGKTALSMEVLVVDDGSKDRTAELVEQEAKVDSRIRLIRQNPNQGKGQAVRSGVLAARGYYIVYADADGATPIEELDKLLAASEGNREIMIGSRRAASDATQRQRNPLREVMGMVFYKTVNYFAVPGIKDSQCGFKMFRHDIAERLFRNGYEKGWAFDVELLYLAQLLGYAITEVPVNWHEVAGSKVSPFKDAVKMLLAVFRIRHRHRGFFNNTLILERTK